MPWARPVRNAIVERAFGAATHVTRARGGGESDSPGRTDGKIIYIVHTLGLLRCPGSVAGRNE